MILDVTTNVVELTQGRSVPDLRFQAEFKISGSAERRATTVRHLGFCPGHAPLSAVVRTVGKRWCLKAVGFMLAGYELHLCGGQEPVDQEAAASIPELSHELLQLPS